MRELCGNGLGAGGRVRVRLLGWARRADGGSRSVGCGCRPFGMCGLVGGVLFAVGSAVVGAVLINGGIGLPGSRMGHLAFLVGRGIRAD